MRDRFEKRFRGNERPFGGEPPWEERRPHRGGGPKRPDMPRGAKTFRRGRALEFLERMNVKRDTLKQQLQSAELQSINPVIVGELKAVEAVIAEFIQLFDIHEDEVKPKSTEAPPEEAE